MQLGLLEKNKINKLLIIGHEYSRSEKISSFIYKAGVEYASVSKNEKLAAQDINQLILKSKKIKRKELSESQLSVSKVWDTLALDLFLGNIDKDFWLWEDSTAVNLLDYWKSLDEKLAFVLVYTDPKNTILNFIKSKEKFTPEDLDTLLSNWLDYNRILLDFFYKNKGRAFLVNTNCIKCIEQLTKKLDLPVDFEVIDGLLNAIDAENITFEENNNLVDFMGNRLVYEYPKVIELYKELQSIANIYDTENVYKKRDLKDIFCELVAIQNTNHNLKLEKLLLVDKFQELEEKSQIINEIFKKSEDEQKKENELLLRQFHLVQEELEKYYIENKVLEEKKEEEKRYYGAAERVKDQLSYRLGKIILEKSKSFFGVLSLPFSLINVILEYKKDMKFKKFKKLPPINKYADAYEAQRVKSHLSYMLGQSIIKTMKKPYGIFILPFKISATYKNFKKNKS